MKVNLVKDTRTASIWQELRATNDPIVLGHLLNRQARIRNGSAL